MLKKVMSGIQPSGSLTRGNYIGALKNFVKLQDDHQCFFMVVGRNRPVYLGIQAPVQTRRSGVHSSGVSYRFASTTGFLKVQFLPTYPRHHITSLLMPSS